MGSYTSHPLEESLEESRCKSEQRPDGKMRGQVVVFFAYDMCVIVCFIDIYNHIHMWHMFFLLIVTDCY